MEELLNEIESYGFHCEAGPLTLCEDWMKLRVQMLLAATPSVAMPAPLDPKIEGRLSVWLTNGAELHELTTNLVVRFARALAAKLAAAEVKYGYSDGWRGTAWMDECRAKLMEHIAKGDPRDVAAYCAFLWHHGESTAGPVAVPAVREPSDEEKIEGLRAEIEDLDRIRGRLGDILSQTAVALRGPEPPLTRWSWHDLPERAAAAIAAIDVLQRSLAQLATVSDGRVNFVRYAAQMGYRDFEETSEDGIRRYTSPTVESKWNFWRASRAALWSVPAVEGREPK